MSWTRFMDMHSGGGNKTGYENIYIEADEETATTIFCNLFDQHPDSVACACCGNNFSVMAYEKLEEATSYERKWSKESVEDYVKGPSVKVVYASEITPELLEESYVEPYSAYDDDDRYEDEE